MSAKLRTMLFAKGMRKISDKYRKGHDEIKWDKPQKKEKDKNE